MKRKEFFQHLAFGTAGISIVPLLASSCNSSHDPLHDIGLITNVVGNMIRKDHRGTMTLLAEMGYKYLEFGGTYDEKPGDLRHFMEGIGLIPLAGGSSMYELQEEGLQRVIEESLALGKSYLVCYWPWLDDGNHPTWENVNFAVDQFNRIGGICKQNGLKFAAHNHDQEFAMLDDRVIYDFMLENTDPELVTMEIDLYWALKGGADVREYFTKYPGRFELVHVKDTYDSPDRQSFACVGSGIIDFRDILSYRNVAGFKHLVVEHDRPDHEEECARSSIQYLHSFDF